MGVPYGLVDETINGTKKPGVRNVEFNYEK